MARLPKFGGDDGSLGQILNDYLNQSLADDGAPTRLRGAAQLKTNAVTSAALATDTIEESKLAADVRAELYAPAPDLADDSVTTASNARGRRGHHGEALSTTGNNLFKHGGDPKCRRNDGPRG